MKTLNAYRPLLRPMHRGMRRTLALALVALITLVAAQASALDGYKDRHGIFGGFGGGIGVGQSTIDIEGSDEDIESDRLPGLALHGIIGGGVSDNLLMGAAIDAWIRTEDKDNYELSLQHYSVLANADFFLIENLYVTGGFGAGYMLNETTFQGESETHAELGFAGGLGGGMEFFLNGTQAMGLRVTYTRHFYENADFDTFTGAAYIRWY